MISKQEKYLNRTQNVPRVKGSSGVCTCKVRYVNGRSTWAKLLKTIEMTGDAVEVIALYLLRRRSGSLQTSGESHAFVNTANTEALCRVWTRVDPIKYPRRSPAYKKNVQARTVKPCVRRYSDRKPGAVLLIYYLHSARMI